MSKNKQKINAAVTIQRFWHKKRAQIGLAGQHNYDFYLSLLKLSNSEDVYNQLARLMYGRVIATPRGKFPFLQQTNPFVGYDSSYHRNDVLGTPLNSLILKQWGVLEDKEYLYIPLVNAQLGTVDKAIDTLGWILNRDYQLIEAPKSLSSANQLKFIKLKRMGLEDKHFTENNRWAKLSSLGIIASPWLLSKIAIDCGYLPPPRIDSTSRNYNQHALKRQAQTIVELKNSPLIQKLKLLKKDSSSEASLLAQALYALIDKLPSDILAPDIIARLSFFLDIALLMHQHDHTRLGNWASLIIHEISLLLLKQIDLQKTLLIDIEEYQSNTAEEIAPWLKMGNTNSEFEFIALPAHSGSHANFIASQLAQDMLQSTNKQPKAIQRKGGEYWEVMTQSREYTLLGPLTSKNDSEILRVSAGAVGDYNAGTYPAIDINKLIRHEVKFNKKIKTLIIDTTSASYQQLALDRDVVQILSKNQISLIFWESCQKFGLLHTDQAQYGRVFAYSHKNHLSASQILSLKQKAQSDLHIPDAQIGAYISKTSHNMMAHIREKHFNNGLIFREVLAQDKYAGINKSKSYELCVDNEKDPFFFLPNNFNPAELVKVQLFFEKMGLNRTSFGHKFNTQEGGKRISLGSENATDLLIFAYSLKYYVALSPEEIYLKINKMSKKLDLFNKHDLVTYLSLIKAWQVCDTSKQLINPAIAKQLRAILIQSKILRESVLLSSPQFLQDIYTIFDQKSPFKVMIREAKELKNEFAVKLFENLEATYRKTGKIEIHDAIRKTIKLVNNIPLEQGIDNKDISKSIDKLISGAYSPSAGTFFRLNQKGNHLQKLIDLIHVLGQKEHSFLKNKHHRAAQATLKLHQTLENALSVYRTGEFSSKSFAQFETVSLEAIAEARITLQHHRGWSHFISILVLSIVSCGILPVVIAYKKSRAEHFRLFETDSTKQLNAYQEQIKNMEHSNNLSFN